AMKYLKGDWTIEIAEDSLPAVRAYFGDEIAYTDLRTKLGTKGQRVAAAIKMGWVNDNVPFGAVHILTWYPLGQEEHRFEPSGEYLFAMAQSGVNRRRAIRLWRQTKAVFEDGLSPERPLVQWKRHSRGIFDRLANSLRASILTHQAFNEMYSELQLRSSWG